MQITFRQTSSSERLMSELTYQSVEFVREWSAGPQNPPYDFNGTVHLMLAALDNIRGNAQERELVEIGRSKANDQRVFG